MKPPLHKLECLFYLQKADIPFKKEWHCSSALSRFGKILKSLNTRFIWVKVKNNHVLLTRFRMSQVISLKNEFVLAPVQWLEMLCQIWRNLNSYSAMICACPTKVCKTNSTIGGLVEDLHYKLSEIFKSKTLIPS